MTPTKREVPIQTFCEGRHKIIILSIETIIRFSHDINAKYSFKVSAEAMSVTLCKVRSFILSLFNVLQHLSQQYNIHLLPR